MTELKTDAIILNLSNDNEMFIIPTSSFPEGITLQTLKEMVKMNRKYNHFEIDNLHEKQNINQVNNIFETIMSHKSVITFSTENDQYVNLQKYNILGLITIFLEDEIEDE
jgi:hypothetical protein